MIEQVILNALVLGLTIALMAIGMSLIFGILRIVNFAHGEFYMLGAVILFYLIARAGMGYIESSVIAIAGVGLLGWVADRAVFRRFHGNLIGGVIAALGLSLVFQNVTWVIFGPKPQTVTSFITGKVELLGATLTWERIFIVAVSLAVIGFLIWFIGRTKLGKSVRAVQQDSEAALTIGVSVHYICGLTFGIATALAALAGVLLAPLYFIEPSIGYLPLVFAFIVIIVGGMGSIPGALIAALIIGFQQSITSTFWGGELAMGVSFGLAILILIIRPRGLMGHV